MPVENAIVRIYDARNTVVGAGFLVADTHVMTCAHVVNSALGRPQDEQERPDAPVTLDFPLVAGGTMLTAQTAVWLPMGSDGGDIAVLRLDAAPPDGAQCAALGSTSGDMWGTEVRTFGFQAGHPGGSYASGGLRGRQADGWLQIDAARESQYFVEAGFSGAPAWDETGRVLGMVVTRDMTPGFRVAFIVPAETLKAAYPPLAEDPSPSAPHVFISYSRQDTEFVERLERDLRALGITTWRDTSSIKPGSASWHNEIADAIEAASVVTVIATDASDISRWVGSEVLYADQVGKPIICVFPADFRPRQELRLIAVRGQPVRFDDPTYDSGLARLLNALETTPVSPTPPVETRPAPTSHQKDEIRYLDFLLSRLKADLRTARYVNLGATREQTTVHRHATDDLDEFELSFERFAPLVRAERIRGDDLDRPDAPEPDARIPLREMPRAILLGDPGAGKTTTLMQLAVDLARDARTALEADTPDDPPPLPVFIRLSGYDGLQTFDDFIVNYLGPLQSQYARLRDAGRLVFLLDALNEMPRTGHGRSLVDDVRAFLSDRARWVVSCRVRDYQEELKDLPEVGKVRLRPLDLPRIKEVIERRFADEPEKGTALWADLRGSDALLEAWRAFEAQNKAEDFWKTRIPDDVELDGYSWESNTPHNAWDEMHRDNRRMMQLCRNPFMLFMVCGTFERLGHLPPNRGALFASFVDNLLRREEANSRRTGRAWLPEDTITQALAQLAYAMQVSETGTEITRAEAETLLHDLPEVSDPALLLRLAASASLLDVGERVRYTHQLLQEYFASEVLGRAMDEQRDPAEFWPAANWWEPQGWEETAIILAGVRGDPEAVARWIAPAQPELAYRALTESGIDIDLDTIQPETRAALVDAANAKKDEVNPVGRAAAYRILGRFDADERRGIGLRDDGLPDLDWVEIPAGEFIYGESKSQQTLTLPTFYITRYPITYRQFQAFIDAEDDFHNPRWWDGLAASDRHKSAPDEQWFKYWNHPREWVSWWDAVAFCRWLSAKLGYAVRLPTEQEWEKAARGTDGREYPWGKVYISGYANIDETSQFGKVGPHYVQQTTAVGMYPQAASPYGIQDMSGNVWEWCLNEHSKPENTGLSGSAARVLRGGSWDDYIGNARCAVRSWFNPYYRNDDIGFRVVCSRPMK